MMMIQSCKYSNSLTCLKGKYHNLKLYRLKNCFLSSVGKKKKKKRQYFKSYLLRCLIRQVSKI